MSQVLSGSMLNAMTLLAMGGPRSFKSAYSVDMSKGTTRALEVRGYIEKKRGYHKCCHSLCQSLTVYRLTDAGWDAFNEARHAK